jgi:DNA-binding NtrC family response regulator
VKGAFTGATDDALGSFRAAHGGTIFFDEIGELGLELQSRLLRVLQQRTVTPVGSHQEIAVDVRVVAATNRDLEQAVVAGRFREDLYHRVNVIPLRTLPLKDRAEDIDALAGHFFARFAKLNGVTVTGLLPGCVECMRMHDWPGNVRELANFVERLVVLGHDKAAGMHSPCQGRAMARKAEGSLPEEVPPTTPSSTSQLTLDEHCSSPGADWATLEEVERDHLAKTLIHTRHNLSETARLLKIGRQQVARKMKKYGLDTTPRRRGRPPRDAAE